MLLRILLFILLWQIPYGLFSQNKQIAFDFRGQPQALMLNPGTEVDFDMHIGIPFLSDAYVGFGASLRDASYNSVFSGSDDIDDVLRKVYDLEPDSKDVFMVNQQLELISLGKRIRNSKFYLSLGMYQEFSGFANYPTEAADLYMNGNDQDNSGAPEYEQEFGFGQLNGMGEMLGVFHVGVNWQKDEKTSFGLRLKIHSGSLGFQTLDNSGSYFLTDGGDRYSHNFRGMDFKINTSGILDPFGENIIGKANKVISGLFFAPGNIGAGVDLGFSHKVSDEVTISASALDLGLTNYKSEVTTYQLEESDFVISDQDYFNPPLGGESGYWKDKVQNYVLGLQLPLDTLATKFRQFRSPKVYGSVRYDMNKRKKGDEPAFRDVRCEGCNSTDFIRSSLGLQLFTEFRPERPLWAVTAYYYRDFTKNFAGKFTYTIDRFSYYNLGAGLSYRIKAFQVFAALDNLLALPKVKDSNYQSFQLGMSFVFNK